MRGVSGVRLGGIVIGTGTLAVVLGAFDVLRVVNTALLVVVLGLGLAVGGVGLSSLETVVLAVVGLGSTSL